MPTPSHGRRRRLLVPLVVLLAVAATLLARPPIALAGTFTVYSCQTPTGTKTGMAGWTSASSGAVLGYENGSWTACSSSNANASLQFGGSGLPVLSGSWHELSLAAPADTTIASYAIERAFHLGWPVVPDVANRPYALQIWQGDNLNAGLLDFQSPLLAGETDSEPPSDVTATGVALSSLHVRLSCWGLVGTHDCGPFAASVTIPRAEVGLVDEAGPEVMVTGGTLTGPGPVRGSAGMEFHATDEGGGVYRVALSVDGVERVREVVDAAGGACADVEPSSPDPYEFASPQPCPLAVDGTVQYDTAALADGDHHVTVTVEDAAGNAEVAFDDTITTHNAPIGAGDPGGGQDDSQGGSGRSGGTGTGTGGIDGLANPLGQLPGHVPNGTAASGRARLVASVRRARRGGSASKRRAPQRRRVVITGRLTSAAGAPIGGARIGAAWKVGRGGWVARAGTTTRADGRFSYALPPGPSRAVRFTYHAFSDSARAVLSNVVRVELPAPLTIRATPRRVTGERVVRLSGRVGGGRVPRGGALVTLQGWQRGWPGC